MAPLQLSECVVDSEPVFPDQIGDDGLAVADRLAVICDIGKLPTGSKISSLRGIMFDGESAQILADRAAQKDYLGV